MAARRQASELLILRTTRGRSVERIAWESAPPLRYVAKPRRLAPSWTHLNERNAPCMLMPAENRHPTTQRRLSLQLLFQETNRLSNVGIDFHPVLYLPTCVQDGAVVAATKGLTDGR